MKLIERTIEKLYPGKWDELAEVEKKWDALEARIGGFPPKRRSRILFGGEDSQTFVLEREWESWDAREDAYTKMWADPEARKLGKGSVSITKSWRRELYTPLP